MSAHWCREIKNTDTGQVYISIKEATRQTGISYGTLIKLCDKGEGWCFTGKKSQIRTDDDFTAKIYSYPRRKITHCWLEDGKLMEEEYLE